MVTWLNKVIDYPLEQTALSPNGIETHHFKPGEKHNEFRDQLNLKPEEKLIVLVSRLAWEKTRVVETAIQPVTNLHKEFPVHLAIVGSGAHKPLIHAAAEYANARVGRTVIASLVKTKHLSVIKGRCGRGTAESPSSP